MPKFKISVIKNQKKYSIVLNAISYVEARKKIHKQGYSILNVEELNEDKISGHKFIFEAIDDKGVLKKGKVVANDPFKVYVKLREGLGYKVKFLYSENEINKSEGIKLDIIKDLEEQYFLYNKRRLKNKTEDEKKKDIKKYKKNLDNFYLRKELDENYKLIDFVLIKLKNILDNADESEVSIEKKQKIKTLYNSIIKIKKTTNISKLKEVGELALKKIGVIELSILEKNKDLKSKKLLNDTNDLLKKIGSKEHFIEKDKDISYIISSFISGVKESFSSGEEKEKKEKKYNIDKESASYWKTLLLIKKYTEKNKEIKKEILKTYFDIFNKDKKEKLIDLKIKLKVIKQNLIILKAKKTGKIVSYTKLIKGYKYFIELLLLLLKLLNTYFIIFIYLFSLLISIFFFLNKFKLFEISLNLNGIFVLIYIIFGSFLIFISRGILSISINIAIFFFMIILGLVNF